MEKKGIRIVFLAAIALSLLGLACAEDGSHNAYNQTDDWQLEPSGLAASTVSGASNGQTAQQKNRKPSDLTAAAVSSTQVNLSWQDNSYEELGFVVERRIGGRGKYLEVGVVDANSTTFSDVNLTPNTMYSYRVYAFTERYRSGYSNVASVTTPVPGWVTYGSNPISESVIRHPAPLALDPDDRPVVAWTTTNKDIYLKAWDGDTWGELGGSASGSGISTSSGNWGDVALAVDSSGRPLVAWATGAHDIYLKKWDGSSWNEIGGSATGNGISYGHDYGANLQPVLALDSHDNPVVAWEYDCWHTYLRKFNGAYWEGVINSDVGRGVFGSSHGCSYPWGRALALDANDVPYLATDFMIAPSYTFHAYLKRANEVLWTWEELDGSATGLGISGEAPQLNWLLVDMALDSNGYPCVTWMSQVTGNSEIYLKCWDGVEWYEVGGSATQGGISNSGGSWCPSIAIDDSDRIFVAWRGFVGNKNNIYLRFWDGYAWQELGGSASEGGVSNSENYYALYPSLALDSRGNPVVSWIEGSWQNFKVHVKRWQP
ncbi:MAG: fibronectin type III domain-containing protein [Deltaproteobacteria bacterium]|nr:fibronectin type III domain-containing protein [Deltaproteobacteria bacterium]